MSKNTAKHPQHYRQNHRHQHICISTPSTQNFTHMTLEYTYSSSVTYIYTTLTPILSTGKRCSTPILEHHSPTKCDYTQPHASFTTPEPHSSYLNNNLLPHRTYQTKPKHNLHHQQHTIQPESPKNQNNQTTKHKQQTFTHHTPKKQQHKDRYLEHSKSCRYHQHSYCMNPREN